MSDSILSNDYSDELRNPSDMAKQYRPCNKVNPPFACYEDPVDCPRTGNCSRKDRTQTIPQMGESNRLMENGKYEFPPCGRVLNSHRACFVPHLSLERLVCEKAPQACIYVDQCPLGNPHKLPSCAFHKRVFEGKESEKSKKTWATDFPWMFWRVCLEKDCSYNDVCPRKKDPFKEDSPERKLGEDGLYQKVPCSLTEKIDKKFCKESPEACIFHSRCPLIPRLGDDTNEGKKTERRPRNYVEADLDWLDTVEIPPYEGYKTRWEFLDGLNQKLKGRRDFTTLYMRHETESIADLMKDTVLKDRVLYDPDAPSSSRWFCFTKDGWEQSNNPDEVIMNNIRMVRQLYTLRYISACEELQSTLKELQKVVGSGNTAKENSLKAKANRLEKIGNLFGPFTSGNFFLREKYINEIIKHCKGGEDNKWKNEGISFKGKWDERKNETDDCLLPLKNGIFDLKRKTFRRYRPTDYLLRKVGVDFDPHARCSLWEKTLSEIFLGDRAVIEWLQRFFGYVITRQPSEHIAVIFYGERGRNGKSLIANTLIKVLGELATSIPANTLLAGAKQNRNAATPDNMMMRGKALCVLSEFDESAKLNAAFLKGLTGSDEIQGRELYAPRVETFFPTHTFIVLTNYRPSADANDEALWRRLILLPFNAVYCAKPDPEKNEFELDNTLERKLMAEKQGILNWLIDGAVKYLDAGRNLGELPETIRAATQEYRENEDKIKAFLDDCCDLGEEKAEKASDLYNVFRIWIERIAGQSRAPSAKTFKERIMKKGINNKRTRNGILYTGVVLKSKEKLEDILGPLSSQRAV